MLCSLSLKNSPCMFGTPAFGSAEFSRLYHAAPMVFRSLWWKAVFAPSSLQDKSTRKSIPCRFKISASPSDASFGSPTKGVFYFDKPGKTRSALQRLCPATWTPCGTNDLDVLRRWCKQNSKHGEVVEVGKKPCQGKRHDMIAMRSNSNARHLQHLASHVRTELNGADALKSQLAEAKQRYPGKPIFIEIYSGSGRVAQMLNKMGYGCITVDREQQFGVDTTHMAIRTLILTWLRSGELDGLFLGAPCDTFSQASTRPRLRSLEFPLGKPGLSAANKHKVHNGNACLSFSCNLIRECRRLNVPVIMENPRTSYIWTGKTRKRLLQFAQMYTTHYCMFNMPWQKPMRFASWNCIDTRRLSRICRPIGGCCQKTHEPHQVLSGWSKYHEKRWTRVAEPYPWPLTRLIANVLLDSIDDS